MAHALHDLGEARLLGVVHDGGFPGGVGAVSVLSHYYGHDDDVRLGAYKGPFGRDAETGGREWRSGPYAASLVRGWDSPVRSSADVPDAVDVYRSLLAAADDHSVAIAAIGFATNLAALLWSPPDATSPLNGSALVARKVKLVTWQGGWYASRHPPADLAKRQPKDEFNWGCGRRWFAPISGCEGTAAHAVNHMPPNVERARSYVVPEPTLLLGPFEKECTEWHGMCLIGWLALRALAALCVITLCPADMPCYIQAASLLHSSRLLHPIPHPIRQACVATPLVTPRAPAVKPSSSNL